jgi:antitoxin HicB
MRRVLQEYGWTYDRMRGSHAAFTKAGERTLIIPTVSGRHVKRPYVVLVLERLGLQEDLMAENERRPLAAYLALDYPVHFVADPDGGYVAVFPDLPGCLTQGETLAETATMAEEARALWLEVEYDRGKEIPLPSYPEEHSGQFRLRLPKSLHRQLAESAELDGVSLNQYVVMLLARGEAQARANRRQPALAKR